MSTQINPEDLNGLGGNMWDHIRREYLAGVKATILGQRWGISLSSFRLHARTGKWRRIDQPISDVPPEAGEYHPDDDVSFADLADLPDITPPRIESNREPLGLVEAEDGNLNILNVLNGDADIAPQDLDSLHPVFLESNP